MTYLNIREMDKYIGAVNNTEISANYTFDALSSDIAFIGVVKSLCGSTPTVADPKEMYIKRKGNSPFFLYIL